MQMEKSFSGGGTMCRTPISLKTKLLMRLRHSRHGSCCTRFGIQLVNLLFANLVAKIMDCEQLNIASSYAALLTNVSCISILKHDQGRFGLSPYVLFFPCILVASCSVALLGIDSRDKSLCTVGNVVILLWCARHVHFVEPRRYVTYYLICKCASSELFMTSL